MINKYLSIAKVNFINSFAYFMDTISSSVFIGVIIFIYASMWTVIFGDTSFINTFTLPMMVWYVVMTEAVTTGLPKLVEDIGSEIRSGTVANFLNKPYHYIGYHYALAMGQGIFKTLLTFIIGGGVALIFIGPIDVSLMAIPFIVVAALLALTLHFAMMTFLGIFAFWFEEVKAFYFIYQKFVFIIGGMLIPLDVFPMWLAKISAVLPFSYVAYHPAKLFVQFSGVQFLRVAGVQIAWILIALGGALIALHFGMRRLEVNGG